MNSESQNTFVRCALRKLSRKQQIRRFSIRIPRKRTILFPVFERQIVEVNAAVSVGVTRDADDSGCEGVGASLEDEREDGSDE